MARVNSYVKTSNANHVQLNRFEGPSLQKTLRSIKKQAQIILNTFSKLITDIDSRRTKINLFTKFLTCPVDRANKKYTKKQSTVSPLIGFKPLHTREAAE